MGVSKNIRMLRTGADMTQQQLADIVGVKREAVAQWEVGLAMPRLGTAVKIVRYFGISLDDLVGDDMPEQTFEDLSDAPTADERELLDIYRHLDSNGRETALRLLTALSPRAGDTGSVSEEKLA